MKPIEVTIMGQSYRLMCPDDGERALRDAVGMVDVEMSHIRDAGKVKARERIAVLAALNLAYRLADQPAPSGSALTASRAAATDNADTNVSDATLTQLLARLDHVLGSDGHLL